MDYFPPPEPPQLRDLHQQEVFLAAADRHFTALGIAGKFAPTFGRIELWGLRAQSERHRPACLQQLATGGVCVISGLKAGGDSVVMSIDRGCAVATREGRVNGRVAFPVPAEIGALLPLPKNPVAPLDCSNAGVTHWRNDQSTVSPAVPASAPVSFYWQMLAGRRVALMPAVPSAGKPRLLPG